MRGAGGRSPGLSCMGHPERHGTPSGLLAARGPRLRRRRVSARSLTQGFVEAATAEAPEVEGDVREAETLEFRDHGLACGGLEEARHLGDGDLETGDLVVEADAELAATAGAQEAIGRRHALEPHEREAGDAGEARGEARARRPDPSRESARAARR